MRIKEKLLIMVRLIRIKPITISFDLLKNFSSNRINEIHYVVKRSKFLAKHAIKNN